MAMNLMEIEPNALALSEADRAKLAFQLLVSLHDVASEAEEDEQHRLWRETIERRVREIREGSAVGRDGETVMREALARLA